MKQNLEQLLMEQAELLTHRQALAQEVSSLKSEVVACNRALLGLRALLVPILLMLGGNVFIGNETINEIATQIKAGEYPSVDNRIVDGGIEIFVVTHKERSVA